MVSGLGASGIILKRGTVMASIVPSTLEPRLPGIGKAPPQAEHIEPPHAGLIGLLWGQRWVMLGCLVASVALMGTYTIWARPVYESGQGWKAPGPGDAGAVG